MKKLDSAVPTSVNTQPHRGETRDCLDPWFQPLIQPDGEVWPCCWFYASLGNARKTPFDQLINGPEFQQLRRELLVGELRKACLECPSRAITTPEKLLSRLRETTNG